MEVFKIDVKEIQNVSVRSGNVIMTFNRISPLQFQILHTVTNTDENIRCIKCGEIIHPGDEETHTKCVYQKVSEEEMIEQVEYLFDEETIITFNKGYASEVSIYKCED